MIQSRWRVAFRETISAVLSEHRDKPLGVVRKALREAFPAGPRKNHPYLMWKKEISEQLRFWLLPPGFPASSLLTAEGCQIAADWWEENGRADYASALRQYKTAKGLHRKHREACDGQMDLFRPRAGSEL